MCALRDWCNNVYLAIKTVAQGMYVTLWYMVQTYRRQTFTERYEYPELPVPVKPRYRGYHRFDLTTCIGCDKCARACPIDCIYIEKVKNPVGKGFRVNGFKIDYTKCMFCALCVDPCPVDCIFMGSTYDISCYNRDGCIVDYAKLPLEVAWGQASLNPTGGAASQVAYGAVLDEASGPACARETSAGRCGEEVTPGQTCSEGGWRHAGKPKASTKEEAVHAGGGERGFAASDGDRSGR